MADFSFRSLTIHLLLLFTTFFAGCTPPQKESATHPQKTSNDNGAPAIGDTLICNLEAEPATLNPLLASDAYAGIALGGVYEALITRDRDTLAFKPQLATSWEISDDKLTYTFKIRQGVKWHDGQPFTAEDVKYTFDCIKNPKIDCPFIRVNFQDIDRCEIVDSQTVRFHASKKYYKTLETLGFSIIPKHIFDNGEDINKHSAGRHPIGTGAYRFVKWDTGSQIVVERNADYWGEKNYPGKIVYKILSDPTVTLQLLKRGDIDMYDRIDFVQWVKQLSAPQYDEKFHKIEYDFPMYSYIGWNLRNPPFNDVRVREAMDHLVDREKIIKTVYFGYARETSGPFFPSDPSYNQNVAPTTYDPVKAVQLLEAAGWKLDPATGMRMKEGKPFSFNFLLPSASERGEKIALILQEELKKVGIVMDITRLEWAVYLERINDWNFQAMAMSWGISLDMDPYQIWYSAQAKIKKSSNFIGYENPAADKLMDAAREEFDPVKRQALYQQLHAIIHNDYPVAFVVVPKQLLAVAKRWHNVKIYGGGIGYDIGQWYVPVDEQKYK